MSNWNYKIEGGYTHVIITIMKAQKEHYFYTDDYTIKMLLAKIEDGEAKIKEEGAKYLYDDIIGGEYIRYYTNYTFKFDFKSWSHQWTRVNNLENRLDNVCVDKTYADIQGGELEVFSLFNKELTGDAFNGYYVKKYDGEKFVNLKVRLDLLFEKISRLEKNFEKGEYLYGRIIGYSYVRYYKYHTIAYRLDLGIINEYSEENYVSSEISRDVKGKIVTSSGNYIADSLRQNKVTAKDIETGKKVYKYVVTYESKPILVEDTGHYITLETGCYKWVEE